MPTTKPDGRLDLLSLTLGQLRKIAGERIPEAAGSVDRVYASVYKSGRLDPGSLGLGEAKTRAWMGAFRLASLVPERIVEEAGDFGTTAKALLRLEDGLGLECVRIPMSVRGGEEGRASLCVSSQVGCLRACAFCETGRHGLSRSLSAGEIIGQVLVARLVLGWEFRNIVFMGMGEPLDNAEAVFTAIEILLEPGGLGLAQDRITLCTAGQVDGLRSLVRRPWRRLRLSISLNAATDRLRERLMPINAHWPLTELAAALRDYPGDPKSILALNYCLIPGLNDGRAEATALKAFIDSLGRAPSRTCVNLIPYNPGPAPLARAPTEEEISGFVAQLLALGIRTRLRAIHGRSIMAACGQLGNFLQGDLETEGCGKQCS